jgi:hypothetical protein
LRSLTLGALGGLAHSGDIVFIGKVISYDNAWNDLEQCHFVEKMEIVRAVEKLTKEKIESW